MILLQLNWPAIKTLLFGEQDSIFLLEILFRTVIMYLTLVIGLRLMGKRGVRQLTIFELVVIIGLGSAAGDPMFYKEVGILSAIAVFITIISCYRLTTYFIAKSKKIETLVEGKTICLIEDGRFCIGSFDKEDLAQDEFFSELRVSGVSQIGQVERAYLEVSGELSVFFYSDENIKPGLPIFPHEFHQQLTSISEPGLYACAHCGNTQQFASPGTQHCSICKTEKWVKAVSRKPVR